MSVRDVTQWGSDRNKDDQRKSTRSAVFTGNRSSGSESSLVICYTSSYVQLTL